MIVYLHIFIGLVTLLGVGIILVTRNIVHAAYALALSLVGMAGVFVLLNAQFLAVVQLLLYAGGVVILLAFGIMMTNRLRGEKVVSEVKNRFLGGVISIGVFGLLSYVIQDYEFVTSYPVSSNNQVKLIGISFLKDHIVAFELIAFILLVVLVGASYLAKSAADE